MPLFSASKRVISGSDITEVEKVAFIVFGEYTSVVPTYPPNPSDWRNELAPNVVHKGRYNVIGESAVLNAPKNARSSAVVADGNWTCLSLVQALKSFAWTSTNAGKITVSRI